MTRKTTTPKHDPAASAQLYILRHLDKETMMGGIFHPPGRMATGPSDSGTLATHCPYCSKPESECRCLIS